MAVKVAINGRGSIGRLVCSAIAEQGLLGKELQVVAIGDIVTADNLAYLLKYDSTQGRFQGEVSSKKSSADKLEDDVLVVNGKDILVVSAKDPSNLPWKRSAWDWAVDRTAWSPKRTNANANLILAPKTLTLSAPHKVTTTTTSMDLI